MFEISLLPFCVVLLALAFGPLLAPNFWERAEGRFLLIVAVLSSALIYYSLGHKALWHTLAHDYVPFMTVMLVLHITASLVVLHKSGKASPIYNTTYLAMGALLVNILGSIATAMILWPNFMRLNKHQESFKHGVVFFICIVCNVGACLTPFGDPPLLVGYLKGVPFGWLLPQTFFAWLFGMVFLLGLFFIVDKRSNSHRSQRPDVVAMPSTQSVIMLAIVLLIIVSMPPMHREVILLILGWLMLQVGGRVDRHFMGGMASLFLALFITLIPVNDWMARNPDLFVNHGPVAYFWFSGLLSAFLDNTPTYIVFTQLKGFDLVTLAKESPEFLKAISLGCVWMGALSYIGNAPNLIVRSYAKEQAPSFLGYMAWSWAILIPLFVCVSFFFL